MLADEVDAAVFGEDFFEIFGRDIADNKIIVAGIRQAKKAIADSAADEVELGGRRQVAREI